MYNIVRLDKVKGTAHLASIVCEEDLQAGSIVKLGALNADGETYKVSAPVDVTADDQLVVVLPVTLQYKEPSTEGEFILKEGEVGRAYILEKGDILTYLDIFFTGATSKGQYAVPINGAFNLAPITALTGEVLAFKVIAKESLAGEPATVLEVVR